MEKFGFTAENIVREAESLLRVGALDVFGGSRTDLFWELQWLHQAYGRRDDRGQGLLATEPDEPAQRLPFPYPLPLRDRALPQRRPAAANGARCG
mgnify:CR=1 FL=1